jgi:hypothetical protein
MVNELTFSPELKLADVKEALDESFENEAVSLEAIVVVMLLEETIFRTSLVPLEEVPDEPRCSTVRDQ